MRSKSLLLLAGTVIGLGQASAAPAQSSLPQIEFISLADAEKMLRAIGAKVQRLEAPYHFSVTWPSGWSADGQLQNCEDKNSALNCRTLSIIAVNAKPKEISRAALMDFINEENSRSLYGVMFLDEHGNIVRRFTFFTTGNETASSGSLRILGWVQQVRRSQIALAKMKVTAE